jgi:hypothetical protein
MDCWLSTFYNVIWKHRNDLTIPKNLEQIKKRRYQQKYRQKKKKQAKKETWNIQKAIEKLPEIERIIDKRIRKKEIQYLVKYFNKEPIWAARKELNKFETYIKEFEDTLVKRMIDNTKVNMNLLEKPVDEISPTSSKRRMTNLLPTNMKRREPIIEDIQDTEENSKKEQSEEQIENIEEIEFIEIRIVRRITHSMKRRNENIDQEDDKRRRTWRKRGDIP